MKKRFLEVGSNGSSKNNIVHGDQVDASDVENVPNCNQSHHVGKQKHAPRDQAAIMRRVHAAKKEQLCSLIEQVVSFKNHNNSLNHDNDLLRRENSKLKTENSKLIGENSHLSSELSRFQLENVNIKAESNDWRRKMIDCEEKYQLLMMQPGRVKM